MGARILRRRKEKGLTQEALANKLGVSNQAVSKWEGDVCCPDLQLLPLLADTLELSLDELFGRESMAKTAQKRKRTARFCPSRQSCRGRMTTPSTPCSSGHRLLQPKQGSLFRHDKYDEIRKTVELHFSGTAQDIYSDFSVVCTDSTISGSVRAGDSVTCTDVGGDVTAGDDVTCGNVGGNVQAGDSVHCTGDVQGNVRASDSVTCGNVGGDVSANDSVRCGEVKGNVRASDSVTCGDISGSVSAERVRCTKAGGEEQESFTFTKKGKSFSFPLR